MDHAERIYEELRHEVAGVWFVSDKFGSKIVFKLPTTSIKALIRGCKLELVFGRDYSQHPSIIHIGANIYDDPINFQTTIWNCNSLLETFFF